MSAARLPNPPTAEERRVWHPLRLNLDVHRRETNLIPAWLSATPGTGTYKRKTPPNRGARYVCNHIVEPMMLLWLIEAASVEPATVEAARQASLQACTIRRK